MERCSSHTSFENCKLKQWDNTAHLLGFLKSQTLTPPNADEDMEQELTFIVDGNAEME